MLVSSVKYSIFKLRVFTFWELNSYCNFYEREWWFVFVTLVKQQPSIYRKLLQIISCNIVFFCVQSHDKLPSLSDKHISSIIQETQNVSLKKTIIIFCFASVIINFHLKKAYLWKIIIDNVMHIVLFCDQSHDKLPFLWDKHISSIIKETRSIYLNIQL